MIAFGEGGAFRGERVWFKGPGTGSERPAKAGLRCNGLSTGW